MERIRCQSSSSGRFTSFSASRVYQTARDPRSEFPDGNSYRDLPAFSGPVHVVAASDALVYSTLLYENAADNVLDSYTLRASRILENATERARFVLTLTREADGRYMLGQRAQHLQHALPAEPGI